MIKNNKGYYELTSFKNFPNVVHGFSTKKHGSMSEKNTDFQINLNSFLHDVSSDILNVFRMQQIHDDNIMYVDRDTNNEIIPNTDALITNQKNNFLVVRSADCLPIMFYDKKRQVIAAAHAGWKGILLEIAPKVVEQLLRSGSSKNDIYIGIGPSIGACCYEIDNNRKQMFLEKYPKWENQILIQKNEKIFLSLSAVAQLQLENVGIIKGNIENSDMCTMDSEDFYSYRKQIDKDNTQLIAGVIGMI